MSDELNFASVVSGRSLSQRRIAEMAALARAREEEVKLKAARAETAARAEVAAAKRVADELTAAECAAAERAAPERAAPERAAPERAATERTDLYNRQLCYNCIRPCNTAQFCTLDQTQTVSTAQERMGILMTQKISALAKSVDYILNRVNKIENNQKSLEERISKLELQDRPIIDTLIKEVKQDLSKELKFIQDDVRESSEKVWKMNNIVLMGVPETEEGLTAASKLMKVILPNSKSVVKNQRIGRIMTNNSKPRPIRIHLESHVQVQDALNNCKQLKGNKEFKAISVCKDLTKKQQLLSKLNYDCIKRNLAVEGLG